MGNAVAGSILAGFGILAQVLVEYFAKVEVANFSMVTEALVWGIIALGLGIVIADIRGQLNS